MVDSLRTQVDEKERAVQDAQKTIGSLELQLGQEQANHRHSKEYHETELSRMKIVHEAMQRQHDVTLR